MATVYENNPVLLDAAASIETVYNMAVGDTVKGVLSHKFDEDWIRIELEREKTYRINLSGRGEGGDAAGDTILKLFDARGYLIATNDDIDTAGGRYDSELIYTATYSGAYYLSAGSYTANPGEDNSGAYTLTVVPGKGPDINGSYRAEILNGTNQGEIINGLGRSDTLNGRNGDDNLNGGSGDDTLVGGPGADELVGGPGADTASYTGSRDGVTVRLHNQSAAGGDAQGDTFGRMITWTYTLNGETLSLQLPDIIHLTGSGAGDVLAGDARANTLRGGAGDDKLYGGPGGNETNDDNLYGGAGDDHLYGGAGHDKLYGGDDNDVLRGGAGHDDLFGGEGDDNLHGGAGHDQMHGGPGADIFVFEPGHGNDDIMDFTRGADRIEMRGFADENGNALSGVSGSAQNGNYVIDLSDYGGGTITLLGVTAEPPGDFIFVS